MAKEASIHFFDFYRFLFWSEHWLHSVMAVVKGHHQPCFHYAIWSATGQDFFMEAHLCQLEKKKCMKKSALIKKKYSDGKS